MKKSMPISFAAALVASLCWLSAPANAAEADSAPAPVAGEKLDSGLGELPHYSKWRSSVAGEKVDSGLGDLPHYSKWADPKGKNPLRVTAAPQRDGLKATSFVERVGQSR